MAIFKDQAGRSWEIRLDAPLVKRVKEITGIALTDLRKDPFVELSLDPILLVDTLWLLCERQAKELGVTDVQFGEGIGDNITGAAAALEAAVVDFFPASRRSEIQSLLKTMGEESTKGIQTAIQRMGTEAMSQKIQTRVSNRVDRAMETLLQDLESTDSAASEENKSAT